MGWSFTRGVLAFLPEGDANEAFLRNTVQASWNEYTARLDEAYSASGTTWCSGAGQR